MSKAELKKIAKKYADCLRESNFKFFKIIIFGSQVKQKANKYSDIDVAIVSDDLKKWRNRLMLWRAGRKVDGRIEPHGFTVKQFADKNNFFANEIKKTGIKI